MSKITNNFIYNIALTVSTFLINLVLFPYVSRVLGVDNIGRVGFVNNVISYFSLFAILGVRTIGIREIARAGDNYKKRSEIYSSLMTILMVLTVLVMVVYVGAVIFVPRFVQDRGLLIIGSFTLFFTSFLIEWFYQGIENFKYITIRTVAVKVIYAIAVFALIKESDDIILYFILTTITFAVNSLINLLYARKFAKFRLNISGIKKYFKPIVELGAYNIMISMYTTFNVIYLGFVCSDTEVGYYYTATKLYTIIIGVFFAFTSVMLPRMSSLVSANKMADYKANLRKSFDMTFAAALPIIVYCMILAPQIIELLSGDGYQGAILPMRIVLPIILLSGMAQIWIQQILIPNKKDKIVLYNSICGAVAGIIANMVFVKTWGAVGSAVVLLFSEMCGNLLGFVYVLKKRMFEFPLRTFVVNLIGSLPYVIICVLSAAMISISSFTTLFIAGIGVMLYFFVFNGLLNTKSYAFEFIQGYALKIKHKIHNK